jgi:lysozyme family protein
MPTPTPSQPADLFGEALAFTLLWEGGYSNTPGDRGGATNRGVTQGVYDAYRRTLGLPTRPVKSLEDAELRVIYRERYWLAAKCHRLGDRALSIAVFDFAVNSGVARATRYLQDMVGVVADGNIGPVTLAALATALKRDPKLAGRYIDEREDFLRRIADRSASQQKFLRGWLNRIEALRHHVGLA